MCEKATAYCGCCALLRLYAATAATVHCCGYDWAGTAATAQLLWLLRNYCGYCATIAPVLQVVQDYCVTTVLLLRANQDILND